jgi:hypothetical protein
MFRKIIYLGICLAIASMAFAPTFALAEESPEVKAAVSVAATVPSKICVQFSSFTSNVSEILSDASQKALFTVKLEDCSEIELKNTPVVITSNRGAIDKMEVVDSGGNVLSTGDGVGITGTSDNNGYIFFRAYSNIPGEAIFSARGDGLVDIGQLKLTFLPLPFPKNIVVVAEVPKIISPSGIITIFKPKNFDVDKDKLVNLTMELRIPSWVFYLFIFIILLNTTMFTAIMALVLKIRKLQRVEIEHIEHEEKILEKEVKEIKKSQKSD